MRRRQFIQLGTGFALTTLAAERASQGNDRFVIVGGGIIGASVAYHLARRGAQVVLLEMTRPAAGATGKSFAWINANFSKQPRHYHLLNRLGVEAFRSLQLQNGIDLSAQWNGTVEWYASAARAEELRSMVRRQQEWGYPVRLIANDDFARIEPRVSPGQALATSFSELEGHVDAARATIALLRSAQSHGAKVIYPCEVLSIDLRSGAAALLKTTQGEFRADTAVLACGVDTPKLAAMAGAVVPLTRAPGIVVRTKPQPSVIQSVLVTEDSHFRQQADGRFVVGDDFGPPSTEAHRILDSEPRDFPDPSFAELHAHRIRTQAARYLPALARAEIDSVSLCWRPLPKDGFPILGHAPKSHGIYLAVTHSGVTLGPLIGELIALELLDGVRVDLLESYRPERFVA